MATTTMTAHRRLMRDEEPEWIVWALVLVLLALGWAVRTVVADQHTELTAAGVTISYPTEWVSQNSEDGSVHVSDPFSSPTFPRQLAIQEVAVANFGRNLTTDSDVALAWSSRHAQDLDFYRQLDVKPMTVGGQAATRIEYAYVAAQPGGAGKLPPIVARAQDILIPRGETLTIVTFAAENSDWPAAFNVWEDLWPSLRLQ